MQKLTSKQTVYISLPKEDYVEHSTEEVIITEEKSWFDSLIDNIKNIFVKNKVKFREVPQVSLYFFIVLFLEYTNKIK